MSPNAEIVATAEDREPPPPVTKQRSKSSLPGLFKKVRSGASRSNGSVVSLGSSAWQQQQQQQQQRSKKKVKKRRKKEKNKSLMSMFWKRKYNKEDADPSGAELKNLILFAFDKTETRALLENSGGTRVLNDLDLVAVLREAIRNHQEVHPGSFAKYEELPESFLQSLVCVCVSSMVRDKMIRKVVTFDDEEEEILLPPEVETSFTTCGSAPTCGSGLSLSRNRSQDSLNAVLGSERKRKAQQQAHPRKIPPKFTACSGTSMLDAMEFASRKKTMSRSERADLKQVLKLLEVDLKRCVFDDENSLEDDDSAEYSSEYSDETLVGRDVSFDKMVTDVYCGCLDHWDGGFSNCVLPNSSTSDPRKNNNTKATPTTVVDDSTVEVSLEEHIVKTNKAKRAIKPNSKLSQEPPVKKGPTVVIPEVRSDETAEADDDDKDDSFVSGLTDIFEDDESADKEESSSADRVKAWLAVWDKSLLGTPEVLNDSIDTIRSDELEVQPMPDKSLKTLELNENQDQPQANNFALWESNENEVLVTPIHTPKQSKSILTLESSKGNQNLPQPSNFAVWESNENETSEPKAPALEKGVATPEEKENKSIPAALEKTTVTPQAKDKKTQPPPQVLKTPTQNAKSKSKKKPGLRITITAGSGTSKDASTDAPVTERIENLHLQDEVKPDGEAPPAPQKAALKNCEEGAEELSKSAEGHNLKQPSQSGNQDWHEYYLDHLSSSQGKNDGSAYKGSPLTSDTGGGMSKPEEENTSPFVCDDSMDSNAFFSEMTKNDVVVNQSAISSDSEWEAFSGNETLQEPPVTMKQEEEVADNGDGQHVAEVLADNAYSQPLWTPEHPECRQEPDQEGRQAPVLQIFSQNAACFVEPDGSNVTTPPRDNRSPHTADLFYEAVRPMTDEIRQPALG